MKRITTMTLILCLSLLAGASALAEDGEGKALYDKKCAMCHGKDGVAKSMAKGSANLNDAEWQGATSIDDIVKVVKEGKGKMKGLDGKLTDEQIKLVATYVKTLE